MLCIVVKLRLLEGYKNELVVIVGVKGSFGGIWIIGELSTLGFSIYSEV